MTQRYRRRAVPTGPEVEISDEMRDGVYIRRPGDKHWVLVLREKFEREYESVSSEGDVPAGMALHLAAVNKVEAEKQHARAEAAETSLKLADELARECETALKHYHIHYGSREEIQAALSAYLESRKGR